MEPQGRGGLPHERHGDLPGRWRSRRARPHECRAVAVSAVLATEPQVLDLLTADHGERRARPPLVLVPDATDQIGGVAVGVRRPRDELTELVQGRVGGEEPPSVDVGDRVVDVVEDPLEVIEDPLGSFRVLLGEPDEAVVDLLGEGVHLGFLQVRSAYASMAQVFGAPAVLKRV